MAQKYPHVIKAVRGLGMKMIGIELASDIPAFRRRGKTAAVRFTNLMQSRRRIVIRRGHTSSGSCPR